jgi:hypothetical protein
VDAELREGPLVDQQLQALARGELLLLVLALDLLGAAAFAEAHLERAELVGQRAEARSRRGRS